MQVTLCFFNSFPHISDILSRPALPTPYGAEKKLKRDPAEEMLQIRPSLRGTINFDARCEARKWHLECIYVIKKDWREQAISIDNIITTDSRHRPVFNQNHLAITNLSPTLMQSSQESMPCSQNGTLIVSVILVTPLKALLTRRSMCPWSLSILSKRR